MIYVYYGDVALGCRVNYVTMKSNYNYVLYLFVNSSSINKQIYQSIKVTIVSHMINEFKFQQAISKRKKSLCFFNNATRWIHYYVE